MHSIQVISLSRLDCPVGSVPFYFIFIKIILKHHLIFEFMYYIPSVVAIQCKSEENFEKAGHDHDFLHFFSWKRNKKVKKNCSSTPLLKEADFQLTLLPKLMRLVINWIKACALLIDNSGAFYLPHINIWSDASQTLCYSCCRSLLHGMLVVSAPAEQQHRRSSKHATHKEPYSTSRKLWTFPYISTAVPQLNSRTPVNMQFKHWIGVRVTLFCFQQSFQFS